MHLMCGQQFKKTKKQNKKLLYGQIMGVVSREVLEQVGKNSLPFFLCSRGWLENLI